MTAPLTIVRAVPRIAIECPSLPGLTGLCSLFLPDVSGTSNILLVGLTFHFLPVDSGSAVILVVFSLLFLFVVAWRQMPPLYRVSRRHMRSCRGILSGARDDPMHHPGSHCFLVLYFPNSCVVHSYPLKYLHSILYLICCWISYNIYLLVANK